MVLKFERLGRRLTIAGATVAAACVGGTGTFLFARKHRRPPLIRRIPLRVPRVSSLPKASRLIAR